MSQGYGPETVLTLATGACLLGCAAAVKLAGRTGA
jgi:hypothetical protein